MKYSREEINLCKKIAKYYRRPMGYGDWYLDISEDKPSLSIWEYDLSEIQTILNDVKPNAILIPLWSIQDCIDFLKKMGCRFVLNYWRKNEYYADWGREGKEPDNVWKSEIGKTPLEALLKAVLKIVKKNQK